MLPCHSSARRRNVYIHLSARAAAHGCFWLHGTGAEQQAHLNTRCPLPVANPRGHARSGMRGAAGTWASQAGKGLVPAAGEDVSVAAGHTGGSAQPGPGKRRVSQERMRSGQMVVREGK